MRWRRRFSSWYAAHPCGLLNKARPSGYRLSTGRTPMNALPSDLVRAAQELSEAVTRPIPGSRKIHVQGSRADLKVPMREVSQAQTPTLFGGETNPPITVYDTSAPYTDPTYTVDLVAGLPALRASWITERG